MLESLASLPRLTSLTWLAKLESLMKSTRWFTLGGGGGGVVVASEISQVGDIGEVGDVFDVG